MNTRNPIDLRRTVLSAVLAAALSMSVLYVPFALAEEAAPQRVVNYADLDLSSAEGAAALYERLQVAARAVCSPLQGRDAAQVQRYTQCRQKALTDAVRAVNERTLTALHNRTMPQTAQG